MGQMVAAARHKPDAAADARDADEGRVEDGDSCEESSGEDACVISHGQVTCGGHCQCRHEEPDEHASAVPQKYLGRSREIPSQEADACSRQRECKPSESSFTVN